MAEAVKAERMSYGSAAIAHLENGKTVFVEGAAPGDLVEIEITQEKKSFANATATKIIEPGESRNPSPRCTACGGCPWAQLTYAAQLEAKRNNLLAALQRTAHMEKERAEELVPECVPSPDKWGYRNKIELAAFKDEQGHFQLGMHERGTTQIVPIKNCPLANEKIANAPKALTGAIRYLQNSGELGIYRVGVRGSVRTGKVEVALWTPPSSFPRKMVAKTIVDAIGATGVVRVVAQPGSARQVKSLEVLEGDAFWTENLKVHVPGTQSKLRGGATKFQFTVSAPSFFQVNTRQAENLVTLALEGLDPAIAEARTGRQTSAFATDLYCGAGTFTLPLVKTGAEVLAIEQEGSAVRDLQRNAERAHADQQIEIVGDDVSRLLPELEEDAPDAIVVDPPRAGLQSEVVEAIANVHPQRLAYVSCDPQTFARDAAMLEQAGMQLLSATPVDMFPQTYHVETVGLFC